MLNTKLSTPPSRSIEAPAPSDTTLDQIRRDFYAQAEARARKERALGLTSEEHQEELAEEQSEDGYTFWEVSA